MESESVPTVLVIDDSQVARAKMSQLLVDAGFRVHALPSPIGATRAILANNVNVVVVDVMMPGMRGDRLAALFRSNPRFRNLGVILVSGAAESELRRLCAEVQADGTLAKSKRIAYCVATDDNCYVPTHNMEVSKPQGSDPVWNAANSRNRRYFKSAITLFYFF